MSKIKLGSEPAFPTVWIEDDFKPFKGQSKRFYAACAAMQGMLSGHTSGTDEQVVKASYLIADELLKQENI